MKKLLVFVFVCLLFFSLSLSACSSDPVDSIHPEYFDAGKQALGIAEAYLADKIDLAEAKRRSETVSALLDSLPLLPEKDPQYEQSDLVRLYTSAICNAFALQKSDERTLQLHEDLQEHATRLNELLGFSAAPSTQSPAQSAKPTTAAPSSSFAHMNEKGPIDDEHYGVGLLALWAVDDYLNGVTSLDSAAALLSSYYKTISGYPEEDPVYTGNDFVRSYVFLAYVDFTTLPSDFETKKYEDRSYLAAAIGEPLNE